MPEILENEEKKLSGTSKEIFFHLYEQLKTYVDQVAYYEKKIISHAATDPRCVAVQEIEGIGPITASAVVATIGDANAFKNGREVSAWLGLTPKQHSSGSKIVLGSITKRGDRYVRKLLVHGARTVVNTCDNKTDKKNQWVTDKKHRCGYNKAAVALANKNARVIWQHISLRSLALYYKGGYKKLFALFWIFSYENGDKFKILFILITHITLLKK